MFRYLNRVETDAGDALVGWQIEVVALDDGSTVIDIFADENSTPISTVSGVANRAVSDSAGNYDLYVASGNYSLKFYNSEGVFQKSLRYLNMYGDLTPEIEAARDATEGFRDEAEGFKDAAATSAAESAGYASALSDASKRVYIYLHYGQSLSLRRSSGVTTSISSKLLMPNGGTEIADYSTYNASQWSEPSGSLDSLVPFSYPDDEEDTSPGVAYQLVQMDGLCQSITAINPGDGGRHWRELRSGSFHWANMTTALERVYQLYRDQGYAPENIIPIIQWTQGEAEAAEAAPGGGTNDTTPPTVADMQGIFTSLRTQMIDLLSEVWGRSMAHIPIFLSPMNTNANEYVWGFSGVQQGFAESVGLSGVVVLPPAYQFADDYSGDGVHRIGAANRAYGELVAKKFYDTLILGLDYEQPAISMAVSGSSFVLTGDFGTTVLEFDKFDPSLGEPGSQSLDGFAIWDNSASAYLVPTSVTVSGNTITVASPVTPASGDRLEYAQQTWPGGTATTDNIPRGNIRTTRSPVTAEDGTLLYDPILNQRWEVT